MSNKSEMIRRTFRLPRELNARATLRARLDHTSLNNLVLQAVREYLGDESFSTIAYNELDRNSDQVTQGTLKVDILLDVVLSLAQLWCAHAPEVTSPADREILRKRSERQYRDYIQNVAESAKSGKLSAELWAQAVDDHYRDPGVI